MSFVNTTNYALKKPDVNTEIDTWGDDINTNFDTIDTRLKADADAAAAASALAATKSAPGHTHATTDITSGTLAAARMPALTGDITTSAGAVATTITAAAVSNTKLAVGAINTVKGTLNGTSNSDVPFSSIAAAASVADGSVTNIKLANMAQNTVKGRITASTGVPEDLTATNLLTVLNTATGNLVIARSPASVQKFCAVFKFDAGASVIPVGSKDEIYIPFAGTITGWTILTDVAGTITFDLWGVAYSSFPPTVANTITAAAKPLIGSSAQKGQSSTLTGWTTTIGATQTLIANVDACATIKRATLILEINKTA